MQTAINKENTQDKTAENAFAKCCLAAGLFINDVEVPWMNFERFCFEHIMNYVPFFLFGSDRSPRRGNVVRGIMLRMALKMLLQHSKEYRGILGQAGRRASRHASRQAGKQAGR